jgi:hypothetical protein
VFRLGAAGGVLAGIVAATACTHHAGPDAGRDAQAYPRVRLVLYGISGSAAGDAWAVGENGVIARWNGHEWRLHSYRAPAHLRDVWSVAHDDVWAVGASGLVIHFDGTRWSPVPSGVTAALRAVWSPGNGEVWIVGDDGVVLHRGAADGSFARMTIRGATDWHDVAGTSPRDVWFVGDDGAVARWDGATVHRVESGTHAALRAIWLGTAAEGWIVGAPDESLADPAAEAIALHWDGAALTVHPTGTREPLLGVWGSGPNDVWAVGQNFGRNEITERSPVIHWDGYAWGRRSAGASGWYAGVWGDGSGTVWVAGCCEPLLQWRLTEWTPVTRASMLHAPDPPLPIGDGRVHRRW